MVFSLYMVHSKKYIYILEKEILKNRLVMFAQKLFRLEIANFKKYLEIDLPLIFK